MSTDPGVAVRGRMMDFPTSLVSAEISILKLRLFYFYIFSYISVALTVDGVFKFAFIAISAISLQKKLAHDHYHVF